MINSKGSLVVVGQERAFDGLAGVVVVPDRCGEGEDALPDPCEDTGGGASAVAFEVELAFEGVVDRFDDLPEWFEESATGAFGFTCSGRSQQLDAGAGQRGLEVTAVVVLVADDDLTGPAGQQSGAVVSTPGQS